MSGRLHAVDLLRPRVPDTDGYFLHSYSSKYHIILWRLRLKQRRSDVAIDTARPQQHHDEIDSIAHP